MTKRLANEEVVERLEKIFGDKYDYSEVDWKGQSKPIKIVCKQHGVYAQTGSNALAGKKGCKMCAKLEPDDIVLLRNKKRAQLVHGDKYEYLNIYRVSNKVHLIMLCEYHGEFRQRASHHIAGSGCPKCGSESAREALSSSTEDFIAKAATVHGDRYKYKRVSYMTAQTPVKIECKDHGYFYQTPNAHLRGSGCIACGGRKKRSNESFIRAAVAWFGGMYDYSKVEYKNNKTKVVIICHEHGEFNKKAYEHLAGSGCPYCVGSKGEYKIKRCLEGLGVKYIKEYSPKTLINSKTGRKMRIDFYLPDYHAAIEFDGRQHFVDLGIWEDLSAVKGRDAEKNKWCKKNEMPLLRIPYWEENLIEKRVGELLHQLEEPYPVETTG